MTKITRYIPKGTLVYVRTMNGGEITGKLIKRYRPTYHAVIERDISPSGAYVVISACRIRSIDIVET